MSSAAVPLSTERRRDLSSPPPLILRSPTPCATTLPRLPVRVHGANDASARALVGCRASRECEPHAAHWLSTKATRGRITTRVDVGGDSVGAGTDGRR